jgi:alkaline phosphatase
MVKRFAVTSLTVLLSGFVLLSGSPLSAQTVYPIDRAEILAGAQFDFKVEFPDRVDPAKLKVTVNGEDYAAAFGRAGTFIDREDGKDQSALILRDVTLAKPGSVAVEVSDGTGNRSVAWTVYETGPRKARNVILFIGDGMSPAHRVAARILSKGISEGKSLGKLAIDDMPHMALVATAGSDSIITDSANSASAYATGHKSAVNAMGRLCGPHRKPVRRSQGRDRYQPRQAAARHGHRYRHQYRDRGCHAGRNDCAHPPPRCL